MAKVEIKRHGKAHPYEEEVRHAAPDVFDIPRQLMMTPTCKLRGPQAAFRRRLPLEREVRAMTFEEYWAIGVQANPLLVSHDILHAIAEAAWNASAKEEREACAKVCEETANTHGWNYDSPSIGREMAHKIRTRSNVLDHRLDASNACGQSGGSDGSA